jgi:hypothetical protein
LTGDGHSDTRWTLCLGLDVRADPRKTIASEKSQTIAYHTEMIKAVILLFAILSGATTTRIFSVAVVEREGFFTEVAKRYS